jgi:hypothetical protein
VLAPTRAEDVSPSDLQNNNIVSLNEYRDGNIGDSRAKQQDLEYPPVAAVQATHEELANVELEDGQSLVKRLLGKRTSKTLRH